MNDVNQIPLIFCGPIPNEGEVPAGGYQACNRRTIVALTNAGFIVKPLAYPYPRSKGISKLLAYVTGFLSIFAVIAKARPSVLHVTGLYKQFIYLEYIVTKLAKNRRCRVIYDIRAGAMMRQYDARGALYRRVFRSTLLLADTIMIEGLEYEEFVRKLTGKQPIYLPNHIDFDASERDRRRQPETGPTLVFLGRIVPEKGIEIVLAVSAILTARGIQHRTLIAGDGEFEYLETLKTKYDSPEIKWLGPLDSGDALSLLESSHFFLFPTRHVGEGHSNALTEAMAAGCVPIASRNGFSASVIGETGVVLELNASAEEYADIVCHVWNSGGWERLSRECSKRVQECFSSQRIVQKLAMAYESLWKRM